MNAPTDGMAGGALSRPPTRRTPLKFCCPQCRGQLRHRTEPDEAYRCPSCLRDYPVVLGIPDFRVYPDPYIDYADDQAKAARVAAQSDSLDFAGLVRFYWSITPDVPADMVRKFVWHAESGVQRGEAYREEISELLTHHPQAAPVGSDGLLDVGCGTGGFLLAAAPDHGQVVGADIAMRWLVIARKRFEEAGRTDIPLVCCCAEHLPFPDGEFDVVTANAVLEHVPDQQAALQEACRVLRRPGALFLATTNRLTLAPEPHVRVWGVGFLPRTWMEPYVRLVRRIPYRFIRSLSCFELVGMLRRTPLRRFRVFAPPVGASEAATLPPSFRPVVAAYNLLRRVPIAGTLVHLFGPLYHVIGFTEGEGGNASPGAGPDSPEGSVP